MGALVLLHVVFPGKGFVAGGAVDVFLAGVLFAMTRRVAGGRKGVRAGVADRVRAGIFLFGLFGGRGRGGIVC